VIALITLRTVSAAGDSLGAMSSAVWLPRTTATRWSSVTDTVAPGKPAAESRLSRIVAAAPSSAALARSPSTAEAVIVNCVRRASAA
jgi:hypothetical protein